LYQNEILSSLRKVLSNARNWDGRKQTKNMTIAILSTQDL